MSKRILLGHSPTGVTHTAHIEDDGAELIVSEFTPSRIEHEILDNCARLRSLTQVKGRNFKLAAQVPVQQHTRWKMEWRATARKDGVAWPTFLAMKINDPDYKNLRIGVNRL